MSRSMKARSHTPPWLASPIAKPCHEHNACQSNIKHPPAASMSHMTNPLQDHSKNPAKPILLLVGGLYVLTSPMAMLTGLQAGLHLVGAGFAMLFLGSSTIRLGLSQFTPFVRNLTIGWGCCLMTLFCWAGLSVDALKDFGAAMFFGVMLVAVTPIPILAFRQSPHSASDPRQFQTSR